MLGCPVSTDHAHRMRAFNHVLGNTAAATLERCVDDLLAALQPRIVARDDDV